MIKILDQNNEKGFSLIEILISMGLFAIGSLAIISLYYSSTNSVRSSAEKTDAVFLAENYLNKTLALKYADTGESCTTCMKTTTYPSVGKYNIAVDVDRAGSSTNPLTKSPADSAIVTVTVSWGSGLSSAQHVIQYVRAETKSSGI